MKISISHEWIYQYVLKDKLAGGSLYLHLRCQKKRNQNHKSGNCGRLTHFTEHFGLDPIKKEFNNIFAFDNACNLSIKTRFKILSTIKDVSTYHLIIFLVNHKENKEIEEGISRAAPGCPQT